MIIYSDPVYTQISNYSQETSKLPAKYSYFLVEGYIDSPYCDSVINEFACAHMDSVKAYTDYYLVYLNKSARTNFKNIKMNPKDLDRYSIQNDLLFQYTWSNGKFLYMEKYNLKLTPSKTENILECSK